MLYALTFRVFLLAVATTATIMALYAFKKLYALQSCTRAVMDGAPGISGLLCAYAPMLWPVVTGYLRDAERKALAIEREDTHRIQNGQDIGYTPVR